MRAPTYIDIMRLGTCRRDAGLDCLVEDGKVILAPVVKDDARYKSGKRYLEKETVQRALWLLKEGAFGSNIKDIVAFTTDARGNDVAVIDGTGYRLDTLQDVANVMKRMGRNRVRVGKLGEAHLEQLMNEVDWSLLWPAAALIAASASVAEDLRKQGAKDAVIREAKRVPGFDLITVLSRHDDAEETFSRDGIGNRIKEQGGNGK